MFSVQGFRVQEGARDSAGISGGFPGGFDGAGSPPLAEKHDDRHIRNKIEGVNRSRGEAGETFTNAASH